MCRSPNRGQLLHFTLLVTEQLGDGTLSGSDGLIVRLVESCFGIIVLSLLLIRLLVRTTPVIHQGQVSRFLAAK